MDNYIREIIFDASLEYDYIIEKIKNKVDQPIIIDEYLNIKNMTNSKVYAKLLLKCLTMESKIVLKLL